MKESFGDALDETSIEAMQVGAYLNGFGASRDEVEEIMAMIMNRDGCTSPDFIGNLKKIMESGGASFIPERTNMFLLILIIGSLKETPKISWNKLSKLSTRR